MLLRCFDFYPRSPCGERLPSASGAGPLRYFYPRSPCGERPTVHIALRACSTISIHALLAESDSGDPALERYDAQFLSTLSLRRATVFVCVICQRLAISIHALLAESDNQQGVENMRLSNISIHALLAESDAAYVAKTGMTEISIHALLAESDHVGAGTIQTPSQISIHALLAESDQLRFLHNLFAVLFLSTLSLRRATTLRREPRS